MRQTVKPQKNELAEFIYFTEKNGGIISTISRLLQPKIYEINPIFTEQKCPIFSLNSPEIGLHFGWSVHLPQFYKLDFKVCEMKFDVQNVKVPERSNKR